MSLALGLLLAAAFDGRAALGHASALSALGPHPWGSPRNRAAAEYVATQLRDAGLTEVRLQEFEAHGIAGTNVIGAIRGPGAEAIVLAAHHDTAPDAPGAYDDGGGVGILIEAARVLARQGARTRTIVFASFDGEEAWATGKGTTTGSRAYLKELGVGARDVAAALVVEMSGWSGGAPVLHPTPYVDPRAPARSVVTPAWLMRSALDGSRLAGAPLGVGDPLLSWLYQPAVRTFRVRYYGDDLSFLQAGVPAVYVSDSSFTRFYPWYHQKGDTADKLDEEALRRMGTAVLGALEAMEEAPRGPAAAPQWFSAFGRVGGPLFLLVLGLVSVLPVARAGFSAGGAMLAARVLQIAVFLFLLWREPVPALAVLLLPNLRPLLPRGLVFTLLSWTPALALAVLGTLAWRRGFVQGFWLTPLEVALLGLGLVLSALGSVAAAGGKRRKAAAKPRKKGSGRRGLP
jgi:hypothetical protein